MIPVMSGGKLYGYIDGRCFVKKARSNHQLRKPPAWATDTFILDVVKRRGVRTVIVKSIDEKTDYIAPLSEFETHGVKIERGFGEQTALPLCYWQTRVWDESHEEPCHENRLAHSLEKSDEYPNGVREYRCPTCGYTLLIRFQPEFQKLVLHEGDPTATHPEIPNELPL